MSSASSHSAPPPIVTRREFSLLSAARLRALASAHGLPSSGRKSALIDRLYRLRNQQSTAATQASSHDSSSSRSASPDSGSRSRSCSRHRSRRPTSPSRLERTAERLVRRGLRDVETRLRRAVQSGPQAPAAQSPDNISLPSPTPGTTSDTVQQHSATAEFSTSLAAPASASASSAPPPVQQPPIPDKVKQRILRGEYIDFDTLLPESLYPARYGASSTPAFTLRLSNDTSAGDGDVVIPQQKPVAKRSVCDLAAWMEAWNLYVQVLVAAFPDRAPVLLAYQAIICGASSRFPPRLWLRYDQRFHYCTIDSAAAILNTLGPGALMGKMDLKNAFRLPPVRRLDWHLLGIFWHNHWYLDKCLPFGLRSSPSLFNQLAEALEWILIHNYGIANLIHYLDDFFMAGSPHSQECHNNMSFMASLCARVNAPLKAEKTEGPTTTLTFLGIELNSATMTASISADRKEELIHTLRRTLASCTCTKRTLLSLIGKLSFACKVVPPGRIFLRRLIDLYPLFVFQDGTFLTRPALTRHLRSLLQSTAGNTPASFASLSFRIGAATTAAAVGLPDWQIQAMGRWTSDCYTRYIRIPPATLANASAMLAGSNSATSA